MADVYLKVGDTYPPLTLTLLDNGAAIDLTTAFAVFVRLKSTTVAPGVQITGTCTIASATGGFVKYNWGGSDTWVADLYNGDAAIVWASGNGTVGSPPLISSVPNGGASGVAATDYFAVQIIADA